MKKCVWLFICNDGYILRKLQYYINDMYIKITYHFLTCFLGKHELQKDVNALGIVLHFVKIVTPSDNVKRLCKKLKT